MTAPPPQHPIVVLDATSMLFRAFYATPSQKAPDGEREVGGLGGFVQIILKLLRRATSKTFVVVFDPAGKTFRHALDPNYKAKRKAPPKELVEQAGLAEEVCRAMGLLTFRIVGFEADDVIATLARMGHNKGRAVWMVSPDKDLFQMVDDGPPPITLWRMEKRQIVDAGKVEELIGVPPDRAITYFSLVGDSADNIPGVRGVGPKAAASIVRRFKSLDEIYANLVRMWALPVRGAKTLGEKLEKAKEQAYLAEELIRLRDDVPLPLDGELMELARWCGPRHDAEDVFHPLGLGNLLVSAGRIVT